MPQSRVTSAWEQEPPQVFSDYLLTLGRLTRSLDPGIHCAYPSVLAAEGAYYEWLEFTRHHRPSWYSDALYRLPEGAVAIGHHEGYVFGFFEDLDDPNPPVLFMREAAAEPFSRDELGFGDRVLAAIEERRVTETRRLHRIQSRVSNRPS